MNCDTRNIGIECIGSDTAILAIRVKTPSKVHKNFIKHFDFIFKKNNVVKSNSKGKIVFWTVISTFQTFNSLKKKNSKHKIFFKSLKSIHLKCGNDNSIQKMKFQTTNWISEWKIKIRNFGKDTCFGLKTYFWPFQNYLPQKSLSLAHLEWLSPYLHSQFISIQKFELIRACLRELSFAVTYKTVNERTTHTVFYEHLN